MKIDLKTQHIAKRPISYVNIFYQMSGNTTIPKIKDFVKIIELEIKSLNLSDIDKRNFRGEILEVFAEIFFNLNSTNARYGIKDYTPTTPDTDFGIDAYGKNPAGNDCVIQVKYRKNPAPRKEEEKLHWEDLAKTHSSGILDFKFELKEKSTIFLFTTLYERSVSYVCEDRFGSILRIIDRKFLDEELYKNKNFWDTTYQIIIDYLKDNNHPCVKQIEGDTNAS